MDQYTKIIDQEVWRAIKTPDFEECATLDFAKQQFREWHADQKWPNPKTLESAMNATSKRELLNLAKRSLAKGLRHRLSVMR